ncbi:MAG: tyrosine-type recombinase/integrase [Alphaproteobacteria bacterium]|nr:tyrosine-type recombinase/integrase [Alphaproteobacteria bacterium]
MKLSDAKIKNAQPRDKEYSIYDEDGLHILIKPIGSKLWRFRYTSNGKRRIMGLGPYPLLSLAEARQKRDEARKLVLQNLDPIEERHTAATKQAAALAAATENSFESVARRWLDVRKATEVHKIRSLRRLELYAFPTMGARPIQDITTLEIVTCLETVEQRGIVETAHRVKHIVQQVFRYAVRRGHIVHNPAADLRDVLSFAQTQNYSCIPPSELKELLTAIDAYDGDNMVQLSIKLMALTFVRTNELMGARWDEFDWDRNEWRIPADRMKMKRPHVVPLARQTIAVLDDLKRLTGGREFVFYKHANFDKHMSNGAILTALRRMGYSGRMTGHGFRSLASTILNEQRKYHPDVIEKQLAHTDQNQVRAAYNRADYLMERKVMMQDWADFLDSVRTEEKVVPLRFGTK